MKTSGLLPVSLFTLLLLGGGVRAATPDDRTIDNPYSQFDPDGVPLSVTQGTGRNAPSPAMIDAARKQATADVRARNWLLLEYEQQMRLHSEKLPEQERTANPYLQLSMNKSLAKLAGLDGFETQAAPATPPSLMTGGNNNGKNTPSLRPSPPSFTPASGGFKPLVTPLSSPGNLMTQGFAAPLPSVLKPIIPTLGSSTRTMPAPGASPQPAAAHVAHSSAFTDITDLQTPGMIAAKGGGLSSSPSLNLDSLPGETPEEAKTREEAATRLVLPLPMDVDQLHDQQTGALKVAPVSTAQARPGIDKPDPLPAAKPILVNPEDAPVPVSQAPQISPVHAAIGNPYDILDR